jgi:hypothetical protein
MGSYSSTVRLKPDTTYYTAGETDVM